MSDLLDTIIIGSGFSGLGMAVALKKSGRHDFVILEQSDGVGGTWRDNRYPGCACDVPSHLYSFSFEPNPDWSRMFAPAPEILAYLEHCATKYELRQHVRFGRRVNRAAFDERESVWTITTSTGEQFVSRFVVFGLGALSRPALPDIPGLNDFQGELFHSAEWQPSHDLRGKRVAVIGTGASAIQLVPEIAKQASKLVVFQRTPSWVVPKLDRRMATFERAAFKQVPLLQKLYRAVIYLLLEGLGVSLTRAPRSTRAIAALGRWHLGRSIKDPALRRKLTPTYLPGCKRILMSNSYYPALAQPNVDVVTAPITELTPRGVVTNDGTTHEVDVIVLATGFKVTELLTPLDVIGRDGANLNDVWREQMRAYLGTTIAGFPNAFMLLGPNTGLGSNSMIVMIERQIAYAQKCMQALRQRGARSLEVLQPAQDAFNVRIAENLVGTVWSTGCQSWYLDKNGHNPTVWPGLTLEYWWQTKRVKLDHYRFTP